MTAGSNPTYRRSKLGTKRYVLTDAKGIPLSAVMSSASTYDIKLATDVVNNMIIKWSLSLSPSIDINCPEKENCNTHALIRRTISRQQNRNSSAEGMYRIYHTREKEERSGQKHKRCQIEKNILPEDGWWREQTHGTTGSGKCSQGMKRKQRTILGWCSSHAVSSSTEK